MKTPKITTKEIDIHAFQKGIFISDANLISPVAIYTDYPDNQTLENCFDEQQTHLGEWVSFAICGGIGQYSLKNEKPIGIFTKFYAHFRNPTNEEMEIDFNNWDDQVLGPPVKEVPDNEKEKFRKECIVKSDTNEHYFTGPPRLIKSVFLSKVFSEEIPQNISGLVKEIEQFKENERMVDKDMVVHQEYQLFHCNNGKIKYLFFQEENDFDISKIKSYGTMKMVKNKLIFIPATNKKSSVDYSASIFL